MRRSGRNAWHGRRFFRFVSRSLTKCSTTWRVRSCSTRWKSGCISWDGERLKSLMMTWEDRLLGWSPAGFERMVAEVCSGKVGAVAAREVSRFASNSREWHQ